MWHKQHNTKPQENSSWTLVFVRVRVCVRAPVVHELPQLSAPCCLLWALLSETSTPHCSDSAHSRSVSASSLPDPFLSVHKPRSVWPLARIDSPASGLRKSRRAVRLSLFAGHFKCVLHSAADVASPPAAYNVFRLFSEELWLTTPTLIMLPALSAPMCWFWAFTPHIKLCQDSRIFRSHHKNINKLGCSLILQINHYATGINTSVLEIGVTFGTGFYRNAAHVVSKDQRAFTLYRLGAGNLKSAHLPAQCDDAWAFLLCNASFILQYQWDHFSRLLYYDCC